MTVTDDNNNAHYNRDIAKQSNNVNLASNALYKKKVYLWLFFPPALDNRNVTDMFR